MNYGEFANHVNVLKTNHPELRAGQAMMIALNEFDSGLYERITGTEADCFYDDKKIPKFISVIFDNK